VDIQTDSLTLCLIAVTSTDGGSPAVATSRIQKKCQPLPCAAMCYAPFLLRPGWPTYLSTERRKHNARLNRRCDNEVRDDDRGQAAATNDIDQPQRRAERSCCDHCTDADGNTTGHDSPDPVSQAKN